MSEDKKSGQVDWDSVDMPRNRTKVNFLRLKSGNTYTVRLFHKPIPVNRYYVQGPGGKSRSAICENPDTCPVALTRGVKPKSRYGIIVLDRGDKNEVKVLEAPAGVFKDFKKFYDTNQIDPGGNEGPDFVISVVGEGLNTRYEVAYKMGSKPFTPEEKAAITEKRQNGYNLDEIFKPTPSDKIEDVLYGAEEGESAPKAAAAKPAASTPPAKKDEFEWA